jgi:hypothetical protein
MKIHEKENKLVYIQKYTRQIKNIAYKVKISTKLCLIKKSWITKSKSDIYP